MDRAWLRISRIQPLSLERFGEIVRMDAKTRDPFSPDRTLIRVSQGQAPAVAEELKEAAGGSSRPWKRRKHLFTLKIQD